MQKAITTLNEVKESIINAYAYKSGLSRNRISKLMENETWLNARKAVELGFADEILFESDSASTQQDPAPAKEEETGQPEGGDEKNGDVSLESAKDTWQYSTKIMDEAILNMIGVDPSIPAEEPTIPPAEEPADPPSEPELPAEEPTLPTEENKHEEPDALLIGLDGKTSNGSMPYLILKDKLEWMK